MEEMDKLKLFVGREERRSRTRSQTEMLDCLLSGLKPDIECLTHQTCSVRTSQGTNNWPLSGQSAKENVTVSNICIEQDPFTGASYFPHQGVSPVRIYPKGLIDFTDPWDLSNSMPLIDSGLVSPRLDPNPTLISIHWWDCVKAKPAQVQVQISTFTPVMDPWIPPHPLPLQDRTKTTERTE